MIFTANQAPFSLIADLVSFHSLIPTYHHPVNSVCTAGNSCEGMYGGGGDDKKEAHFSVMRASSEL